MTQSTPPGWYPDGQGGQRWWDGNQWTEHTLPPDTSDRPAASEQPAQPGPSDVTQVRPRRRPGAAGGDRPGAGKPGQPPAAMPTQVASSSPAQPGAQPGGQPGAQQPATRVLREQGGFGSSRLPRAPAGRLPGQPGKGSPRGRDSSSPAVRAAAANVKMIGIIGGARCPDDDAGRRGVHV